MTGRAAHPLRKASSIKTRQATRITFFSFAKLEACNHALQPRAKKNCDLAIDSGAKATDRAAKALTKIALRVPD